MKQQPDKIFRDKLINHSKPAPSFAWDRLEEGLDRKKRSFKWYSIAASIALVAVAAAFYYSLPHEPVKVAVNPAKEKIINPKESADRSVPHEQVDQHIEQSTAPASASVTNNSESKRKVEEFTRPETKKENVLSEDPVEENKLASSTDIEAIIMDSTTLSRNAPAQLAFKAPAKEENVTIIFTADQTKEYLITKNTSPEATSQEKKSSTFKKLLKKAADLKVNQDPFGELRQKKNEILALNFRSEKRGQK